MTKVYEKIREIETLQKKPQNQLFQTTTLNVPESASEVITKGQTSDFVWSEGQITQLRN